MERNNQLHRQVILSRQSLFDQGFLDEQFLQLEELQDDANPNFVEEIVTLHYRDSARLILSIEQALSVENFPFLNPKLLFSYLFYCLVQQVKRQLWCLKVASFLCLCRERNPLDFNKLDSLMHQFKGSSSSIGAKKVKAECTLFREFCSAGNGEGCIRTFQQLKKEYATLKKKLEAYFQLARQAGPAQTACRPK
ncbi:hypothetical protein MANES_04G134100v8 [Manihot esculenta]|uniref:Uncharacterized protein n=1 Tax=Manihot esculenta TaxID=3983 RepID=A0ACB7HUT6_MANES|nr:hypothetical protein MANES_04G134100v8 [Manihot esculenta]